MPVTLNRDLRTANLWLFICVVALLVPRAAYGEQDNFNESVILRAVFRDGKWGFIDKDGHLLIKPQFDEVRGGFSEGLACVKVGDKYGYINSVGVFVIPPQFLYQTETFSEGLALVRENEGHHHVGYIDKTGSFVISPRFEYGENFSEGLAWVRELMNDEEGFIDKTGKPVIRNSQFQFIADREFSEGLAVVQIGHNPGNEYVIGKGHKWGYIDKIGAVVIPPQFEAASKFSQGLAQIRIRGKWGYIDKKGKIVIKPQYDWAFPFSDGLARVGTDIINIPEMVGIFKRWYIDKTGKTVIKPRFSLATMSAPYEPGDSFSEGLAWVRVGRKFGFIDKTGQMVIKPQFDGTCNFSNGLACVRVGHKWGYVNAKGQVIVPLQFDNIQSDSVGQAWNS